MADSQASNADQHQRLSAAISHYEAGRYEEAESAFRTLHIAPQWRSEASYGLGLIALAREQSQDASEWFAMVRPESGRYANARYYLGCVREALGDVAGAISALKQAVVAHPGHVSATRMLTRLEGAAMATPPAPPPEAEKPRKPAGSNHKKQAETELWLPDQADELEEYKRRAIAKRRADFMIEAWHQYPVWVRTTQIAFLVGFLAFATWIGSMVVRGMRASESQMAAAMKAAEPPPTSDPIQRRKLNEWCDAMIALQKEGKGDPMLKDRVEALCRPSNRNR